MKRSFINARITWAKELLDEHKFFLPVFAHWDIREWRKNKEKTNTIVDTMLGWDVTDFGSEEFDSIGAVLFTIRNGNVNNPGSGTPYAEKVILMKAGQVLPLHFHYSKTEDIINRGGGLLLIELYNSKEDGTVDTEHEVTVYCDGIPVTVKAGTKLEILPGNSITLRPYIYHKFIADKSSDDLIVGEVSKINDDNKDNHFAEEAAYRFSEIVEDEDIIHLLCNEYKKYL